MIKRPAFTDDPVPVEYDADTGEIFVFYARPMRMPSVPLWVMEDLRNELRRLLDEDRTPATSPSSDPETRVPVVALGILLRDSPSRG